MHTPSPLHPDDAAAPRAQALAHLHAGRLDAAIAAQIQAINAGVHQHGQPRAADCHQLGVILFARQDFGGALTAFQQAGRLDATLPGLPQNLGMCLLLTGQVQAALQPLRQALARQPDDASVHDALAHALGLLGLRADARQHGERALALKDAAAGPVPQPAGRWPLGQPLPAFNPSTPQHQVISFSLFGSLPRYLDGALANARQAPRLYPGWTCRFYLDDSVPTATCDALRAAGAQLQRMPRPQRPADALFWRFLVADDPGVDRFLVRDADAVVNPREAAAVAAWLASGLPFHLMRDHPAHTDLMLAGLWGGVARWLPPLPDLLQGFGYRPGSESRSADQRFLGQRVWPRIRSQCLVHDSLYRSFGAQDFPAGATLPPGRHVGDNASAFSG